MKTLLTLATVITLLALSVRRIDDINQTGWWLLSRFVLVIKWTVIIIWVIEKIDEGKTSTNQILGKLRHSGFISLDRILPKSLFIQFFLL